MWRFGFEIKYIYILFVLNLCICSVSVQANKLIVATYIDPPFITLEGTKLAGEDIDLVKALAKKVHMQPEHIICPIARCLAMVKSGDADMLVSIRKTAQRAKDFIFLQPAIYTQFYPIKFYLNSNSKIQINNHNDLTKLTIGVLRGVSYFNEFDENKMLNKVEVTTIEQLIGMLSRNRIDTFLEREGSIKPYILQNEFRLANYQYKEPVESYIIISKQSKIKLLADELSDKLAEILAEKN